MTEGFHKTPESPLRSPLQRRLHDTFRQNTGCTSLHMDIVSTPCGPIDHAGTVKQSGIGLKNITEIFVLPQSSCSFA